MVFLTYTTSGWMQTTTFFFPVTVSTPPAPTLMNAYVYMWKSCRKPDRHTGKICVLQKVFNSETLTEADEAAVSVVASGKTEWRH